MSGEVRTRLLLQLALDLRAEADDLAPCRESEQYNHVEYADRYRYEGIEAVAKREAANRLELILVGLPQEGLCAHCRSDCCAGISYGAST